MDHLGSKLREFESLLEYLEDQQVFYINTNDGKTFGVCEMCDQYYSVEFTSEQLLILAEEIRALASPTDGHQNQKN
jgi:hypothetical protein